MRLNKTGKNSIKRMKEWSSLLRESEYRIEFSDFPEGGVLNFDYSDAPESIIELLNNNWDVFKMIFGAVEIYGFSKTCAIGMIQNPKIKEWLSSMKSCMH